MGTIPAPDIFEEAQQVANAPMNAMAEYARVAALKQQTALAQQETQASTLQNQQTQAVNQAYKDAFKPDANGKMQLDMDSLQQSLAQNGHGAAIPGIIEGITKYKQSIGSLQEQQQKIQDGARDAMGNLGYAIQQAKYDPQLVHTLIQDELNDPALGPQQKQQVLQLQGLVTSNPNAIKPLADQWVAQSPAQQQREIERQKAVAAQTAAAAEALKGRFKEVNGALYDLGDGDNPKLVTPQDSADPAQWNKLVDLVAPPTGANQMLNSRTKSEVNFYLKQGNMKAAQDAITKAGEQIGSIEKDIAVATNPQIQGGKVAVATAEGQARANVEAQMARGSNAELANVPPRLVTAATGAADKADTDFANAKSISDRLAQVVAEARGGNKVAYQILPQEGALQVTTSQGVHRINMAEIQNYGGGSLWDSIKGKAGKILSGQSIPANILDDMEKMQGLMAKGSQEKYENTLSSINKRYGSTFSPVEMKNTVSPANTDFFSQFGGKPRNQNP